MKITLQNVGKCFNRDWIFKNINFEIKANHPLAIVGNNGSGKSTLLLAIASQVYLSEGNISYEINSKSIHPDKLYPWISFAAPYQELMEELTLKELINFHNQFKNFRGKLNSDEFVSITQLDKHLQKPISKFSSGMKQRLKLALAILSDTPFLFLDEPVSNLDSESIKWFKDLLTNYYTNRITIISSNQHPDEIFCCNQALDVRNYKI